MVSALHNATDALLTRAQLFGAGAGDHAVAALPATGEARSTALLSLALARAEVPAVALDEVRMGLRTGGPVLDAEPCALDTRATLCRANSNVRRIPDLHQAFNTSEQNELNAHAPLGD